MLEEIKKYLEKLSDSACLYDYSAETVIDMALDFIEELEKKNVEN